MKKILILSIALILSTSSSILMTGCSTLQVSGHSLYSSVPATEPESNWDRITTSNAAPILPSETVIHAIRARDILMGMNMEDVRDSWGHPTRIETAGSGDHGNQRWIYQTGLSSPWSLGGSRTVYFEGGHVVGWQTQ